MEEIREVAKAYYVNLTEQQQEKAQDDFRKMKLENNKSMSLTDFLDFSMQENYPESVACSLFKDLDVNGDGSLDFDEFIILFYLYQSKRLLYCRGCETFLNGVYFTCIKCFDSSSNSYDLCSLCYRNKRIQHHHAVFLDNYALLRRNIKRSSETAVDPVQVKNNENEGQYVSELSDHQENIATHEADLDDFNYKENEEVANASNQLEKIANRKVANIPRRKRDRIGKFFARQAANMTSKVVGDVSKAPDSTENCSVM
ncbi:uncharacterized protein LOC121263476 [Juglans microcarpa x Juglans regia]|uniref:uncharacterized protein LOC121263476 n=1 Tax=Juglans microcarpa x Juglans regia TaxID=2249226 RepID=UPI001B7E1F09|nr:uncharacterized protein LOC121263476 [Juglans microcarpa x Juglans regia]